MRSRLMRLGHHGDTIVEVLIAVAIVSSVLAGAFTVSQRSTLAVRDSQERGEMLQLLQGQVELVRSLALAETTPPTNNIFSTSPTSPAYFCINPAGTRADFPAIFSALPNLNSDNFVNYDSACQNLKNRYNVAITFDSTSNVFTFTGRWDGVDGRKKQQQLSYRIYPG